MSDLGRQQLRHLLVVGTANSEPYTGRGRGPRLSTPHRDRQTHARELLRQFRGVRTDLNGLKIERQQLGFDPESGLVLQFQSSPDFDLKFESLDLRSQGIQLLSVHRVEGRTIAACYVPDGKLEYLVRKIEAYRTETIPKTGKPKNRELVESIDAIHMAAVDALWTDDRTLMPGEDEPFWWELWLRRNDDAALRELQHAAQTVGYELSDERLVFPERLVVTAQCTKRQLSSSIRLISLIAELRMAKKTAAAFIDRPPRQQHDLTAALLERLSLADEMRSYACILDTGMTQAHPLLGQVLAVSDCHAYKTGWGVDDTHGHGTEMGGLVVYGNLVDVLAGAGPIAIEHRLESVKILHHGDPNPPHLYGAVTNDGVRLAEQAAPDRLRVVGMAVTAESLEQGEPSTWSAAIDALTSGYDDGQRRLLLVSAGNSPNERWHDHPAGCQAAGIQDPGQAWNALTVGALTEMTNLPQARYPDWHVVAVAGDISPFSSTSCSWPRPWPIKPEIVLEGGNCAVDPVDALAQSVDELSLLTTHRNPQDRPFSLSNMTSASTALATRAAAILRSRYPEFWPETIRGLLVHSADWTDAMQQHFWPLATREQKEAMLRFCGYGAPDFDRACWSANNELTLVAQDSLQPYAKEGSRYKTNEINFHSLPWPTDVLKELRDTPVRLRVTLSYFIEPNPARRGWRGRYRYASHALRFDVKTPTETDDEFRRRVNRASRSDDDDGEAYVGDSADWVLGPQVRHLGSIHSDQWPGTAVRLANRNMIAVYPVVGWWRERPHLGRWNRRARYSLIVTIGTPRQDVDIYTPVQTMITPEIEIGSNDEE